MSHTANNIAPPQLELAQLARHGDHGEILTFPAAVFIAHTADIVHLLC
jgi:hypothetical protein